MSSLEVIGGISTIITVIDGSVKIWDSARKDIKLPETLQTVARRLPLLLSTLQVCHDQLDAVKDTLADDVVESFKGIVQNCKAEARQLREIFEDTIPGENANRLERYKAAVKSAGKGKRVEQLLKSISEGTRELANYHAVKSAQPDLLPRLEDLIGELEGLESPIQEESSRIFYNTNYGGPQSINTGDAHHSEEGDLHCYGGVGTISQYSGTILSGRMNFAGSYAHSSLHPVATYVPRPDLERQLREQLPVLEDPGRIDETRTVVVWGLGGAGKSQLVLNHVHEYRKQYHTLFWVEAGQKQTLERDFIQIHRLLFPNVTQSGPVVSIEDAVTAVKSWFHGQKGRSLWVMDSADIIEDEEDPFYIDLSHYLPDAPRIDIIVTTRSPRAQSLSSREAVAVADMTEDEAIQLFRRCAKLRDTSEEIDKTASAIVQELGCLALAVTLGGSYVNETPRLSSDLSQYLREYRAQREQVLSQKAQPYKHRYSDSALSTCEMSFAAVERRSLVAARLWNLVAFLNFDDIFLGLFVTAEKPCEARDSSREPKHAGLSGILSNVFGWRRGSSEAERESNNLQGMVWTELLSAENTTVTYKSIQSAFKTLQAYSLVSWRADQGGYAMHKLVHAWSHDRLDVAQRQTWSLAALRLLAQVIAGNKTNLVWSIRVAPHVVANFSVMSAAYRPTYRTTRSHRDALSTVGEYLQKLGRWSNEYGVRMFLKQATTVALGPEHPDTLTSVSNLASVLRDQAKYEQAEEMYGGALMRREKVQGVDHPNTLTNIYNLSAGMNLN